MKVILYTVLTLSGSIMIHRDIFAFPADLGAAERNLDTLKESAIANQEATHEEAIEQELTREQKLRNLRARAEAPGGYELMPVQEAELQARRVRKQFVAAADLLSPDLRTAVITLEKTTAENAKNISREDRQTLNNLSEEARAVLDSSDTPAVMVDKTENLIENMKTVDSSINNAKIGLLAPASKSAYQRVKSALRRTINSLSAPFERARRALTATKEVNPERARQVSEQLGTVFGG